MITSRRKRALRPAPRPRSARRGLLLPAAVLCAVSVAVAACTPAAPPAAGARLAALPTGTPKSLAGYYTQKVRWRPCTAPGFQCTTMKVPLDYEKPGTPDGAGAISLAVARKKATGPGSRLGSLLVNPGGPGGSAIGYLKAYAAIGYPAKVRARYDMVAVDPRGVAASTPVKCLNGKRMDTFTQTDATPDTEREIDRLVAADKAFAASCARHSGRLLPHVSTVEAARDMDVLRAVLGERTLSYVGASYGTLLGATYAGLYPHRVGRFVLDGAMDPALSARRMNLDQTAGFETAFRSFARDCARRRDCPLAGTAAEGTATEGTATGGTATGGTAAGAPARGGTTPRRPRTTPADVSRHLQTFFRRLDRAPLPSNPEPVPGPAAASGTRTPRPDAVTGKPVSRPATGQALPGSSAGRTLSRPTAGRPLSRPATRPATRPALRPDSRRLGESLATIGVIAAMYDEAAWPQLREALGAAMKDGDGAALLALSDSYYERGSDGRYANLMSANAAVNCLDLPPAFTGPGPLRRALPEFRKASPVFGEGLAWATLNCSYWPVHATGRPHRIEARGAAPIVVVGTVRDPATPYRWARSLAAQLTSGHLLTYDGDGHTAYGRGSACIDDAVNRYLLTGTPPSDGKRCS